MIKSTVKEVLKTVSAYLFIQNISLHQQKSIVWKVRSPTMPQLLIETNEQNQACYLGGSDGCFLFPVNHSNTSLRMWKRADNSFLLYVKHVILPCGTECAEVQKDNICRLHVSWRKCIYVLSCDAESQLVSGRIRQDHIEKTNKKSKRYLKDTPYAYQVTYRAVIS